MSALPLDNARGGTRLVIAGVLATLIAVGLQIYQYRELTARRLKASHDRQASEDLWQTWSARLLHPETCLEFLNTLPAEFSLAVEAHPVRQTWLAQNRTTLAKFTQHRATVRAGFNGGKVNRELDLWIWRDAKRETVSCFGAESVGALCAFNGGMLEVRDDRATCRQSRFAKFRSENEDWHSIGACRLGGFAKQAADCKKLAGGPYTAIRIQDASDVLQPPLHSRYLCERCE